MDFKKYFVLFFLLFLLSGMKISAQTWIVPEEAKTKVSPFFFSKESTEKGQDLYKKNCQSCHGMPGQNNPAKIIPDPGDPAGVKYQSQNDGEMFWKITNGKTPMPQFQNILTEEERWDVISYVRSFNPKYIQPTPEMRAGSTGKIIKLSIYYIPDKEKIEVLAREITKDKKFIPAKGIEINLFVKRYFGELKLGDPIETNHSGIALFNAPVDLPGDRAGKMELTARISDPTGKAGDASTTVVIKIGKPNTAPSLIAKRAWWSTREMAPVWLIATFSLALASVWGLIFYILFSLRKIRKLNI
jgi:hypothetical protein